MDFPPKKPLDTLSIPEMRSYVVDAFTKVPFWGNGAGVVVCGVDQSPGTNSVLAPLQSPDSAESRSIMQRVAAEINLSETAFTWKLPTSREHAIRYFSPTVEIGLCGHATLAAAKVLWETGMAALNETIVFRTRDGQELLCDMVDGRVRMVFPRDELVELVGIEKAHLMDAFSLVDGDVEAAYKGLLNSDYLLVVSNELFVRLDEHLNMQKVQDVTTANEVRGVIVTTRATSSDVDVAYGENVDIKSRFFCPNAGIPEDPVTGSSFPTLAAFYVPVLKKRSFVGLQDHPRRKGIVHVSALDDGLIAISGDAVVVQVSEWSI